MRNSLGKCMMPSGVVSKEYNPVWMAFLKEEGLSVSEADSMPRQARISLNAKFLCWSMGRAQVA